jgi:hypothetical protein
MNLLLIIAICAVGFVAGVIIGNRIKSVVGRIIYRLFGGG